MSSIKVASGRSRLPSSTRKKRCHGQAKIKLTLFFPVFSAPARPHGRRAGEPIRVVRPAWLYPLLGSFAARVLGGAAEDGPRPPESGTPDDCPMVSAPPAPPDRGTAPDAGPEATWPLRLLRDHWKRVAVAAVPGRRGVYLAEVVGAPPTAWLPLVGNLRSVVAAVRAAAGAGRSLGVPSR